jgi:sensor histidine kinase regulating citrate/malate metabolism
LCVPVQEEEEEEDEEKAINQGIRIAQKTQIRARIHNRRERARASSV